MTDAAPSSKTPLRFAAIILAAGASTRLGQPKQLLLHEGQPLIARAARAALDAGATPVVVVLGAHAEKIRPALAGLPVSIVENTAWSEGMGASIRTGIAALHDTLPALEAVLLALCDQPHFSAASIRQLTNALHGPATIAATRHGNAGGVPALFARVYFPALTLSRGEKGARDLIAAQASATALVDLPELAFDIDTPADLRRLNPGADRE
jgi:Uncharacterized MobA-related protein